MNSDFSTPKILPPIATKDVPQQPPFTIVIPAHNEESVIGSTLGRIYSENWDGSPPEVIVIPNGCSDDTALRAAEAAPQAILINMSQGSKAGAINEALRRIRTYPVIILDADTHMSAGGLTAIADALRKANVMAASPAARLDLSGCDRWTTAYYRVWAHHSYLRGGVGGSGVYGLSHAGAKMLGEFPQILADDTYIRRFFPLWQQRRVECDAAGKAVFAIVRAPRRLGSLVACESRWHAGNLQLHQLLPKPSETAATQEEGGPRLVDRAGFAVVKLLGRAHHLWNVFRGTTGGWHRDLSNR